MSQKVIAHARRWMSAGLVLDFLIIALLFGLLVIQ